MRKYFLSLFVAIFALFLLPVLAHACGDCDSHAALNNADLTQTWLPPDPSVFEKNEVFVMIDSEDDIQAFARSEYNNYIFVITDSKEDGERSMSNWCHVCGNRTAGIFQAFQQWHAQALNCPIAPWYILDQRVSYRFIEVFACVFNCFPPFQATSNVRFEYFIICRGMKNLYFDTVILPSGHIRAFQVFDWRRCVFGFNPHQCWNVFLQGTFFNCWGVHPWRNDDLDDL